MQNAAWPWTMDVSMLNDKEHLNILNPKHNFQYPYLVIYHV